jgi:UDP-N-acetylmuramyl tripeptide synthase
MRTKSERAALHTGQLKTVVSVVDDNPRGGGPEVIIKEGTKLYKTTQVDGQKYYTPLSEDKE